MVPEVLAHLLYSSTLQFRCKNISLKHSRTLSTNIFSLSNVELNILQLKKISGRASFFFKVKNETVLEQHQLTKLTFSQLQIFYQSLHKMIPINKTRKAGDLSSAKPILLTNLTNTV
jgi:hypothetical protein